MERIVWWIFGSFLWLFFLSGHYIDKYLLALNIIKSPKFISSLLNGYYINSLYKMMLIKFFPRFQYALSINNSLQELYVSTCNSHL